VGYEIKLQPTHNSMSHPLNHSQ